MLPHGDGKNKRATGRMTATPLAWRLVMGIVAFGGGYMLFQVRSSSAAIQSSLEKISAELHSLHEEQTSLRDQLVQSRTATQSTVDALAQLKTTLQKIEQEVQQAPHAASVDELVEGYKGIGLAVGKIADQVHDSLADAQMQLGKQRSTDFASLLHDVQTALEDHTSRSDKKAEDAFAKLRSSMHAELSQLLTARDANASIAKGDWHQQWAERREVLTGKAAHGGADPPVEDMEGVPSATSSTEQGIPHTPLPDGHDTAALADTTDAGMLHVDAAVDSADGIQGGADVANIQAVSDVAASSSAQADHEAAATAAAEVEVAAVVEAAEEAKAAADRAEAASKEG